MNRTEGPTKLFLIADSIFNLIRLDNEEVIQKRLNWPKNKDGLLCTQQDPHSRTLLVNEPEIVVLLSLVLAEEINCSICILP
jgi:hypothetical protein